MMMVLLIRQCNSQQATVLKHITAPARRQLCRYIQTGMQIRNGGRCLDEVQQYSSLDAWARQCVISRASE